MAPEMVQHFRLGLMTKQVRVSMTTSVDPR